MVGETQHQNSRVFIMLLQFGAVLGPFLQLIEVSDANASQQRHEDRLLSHLWKCTRDESSRGTCKGEVFARE